MIVKIEGPIQTFAKWKAMVQNNSDKVKKYGYKYIPWKVCIVMKNKIVINKF